MKKLISEHILGDMRLEYILETDRNCVGLCIAPASTEFDIVNTDRVINVQSLAECKIIGDDYSGDYFGGESMKYSGTIRRMKYDKQEIRRKGGITEIKTYLKSDDGLEIIHTLSHSGGSYLTVGTEFVNNSAKTITLEALSSFAFFGISPYSDGAGENTLTLHRLRSKWSMEARLVSESFEDLQLEDCWCYGNSKNIRFGQVGSMPVKNYFPFMAVTDSAANVTWGVQMGAASSWQMEVTRGDDCAAISGGLADREFGHWMKKIASGESFSGNTAVVSVCIGGVDDICPRLLEAQEKALSVPECEETLPIIFNEYCTTWGCPSHDNIHGILAALDGFGVDYFVIDCGWFKADGVPWHISMGDYEPSKTLFPNGIGETVKLINSRGMKAGIWFEIENVGSASKAYHFTDHLLKRDGITLTTVNRRFWDMNDPWVKEYLTERVIGFLKEHGFEYMKVDYNETIGIGCDDPNSLGEGLRQNMEGTIEFFKKVREEIPNLVLENCASGGNRLEPLFMSLSSMASFSDAHECVEIPIIAANLHRAILPRQSQIWCVIRKNDSLKRIAYSVAATFLGRMCLSGDVTELTDAQREMITDGIAFYKKIASVIKRGRTEIISRRSKSDRHPEGYQIVKRYNDKYMLLVVHTFAGEMPDEIKIPAGGCIAGVYSDKNAVTQSGGEIIIKNPEPFSGFGILLERSDND